MASLRLWVGVKLIHLGCLILPEKNRRHFVKAAGVSFEADVWGVDL